jgi:hypothetical protein
VRGYGSVVSRRYLRPFLFENGRVRIASADGESFDVTAVRPLEPVVLDMLLDLPVFSPLATAAARVSADWRAFLRSEFVPDVKDDLR